MNRIFSLLICSIVLPLYGGGTVFLDSNGNGKPDDGEKGIAGIQLSNGTEIVETGSDGKFSFRTKGHWISVTVPDKYVPTTAIWQTADTANPVFGFRPDEAYDDGAAFIHGSDIQFPVARKRGILRNIIKVISKAAEKHKTPMVICPGDLTPYGDLPDLDAVRDEFSKSKLHFYPVFGGHDAIKSRDLTNYRKVFGPLWYSWNFRGVHFAAFVSENFLDKKMQSEQYKWLKEDLSKVPADMPVVLATHAPGQASRSVRDCLGGREPELVLRGHYHNWNIRKTGKTYIISSAPWRMGDNGAQTVRVRTVFRKDGKWQSSAELVFPLKPQRLELVNAEIKMDKDSEVNCGKLVPVWCSSVGTLQDYYSSPVISDGKVFYSVSDQSIGAANAGVISIDGATGKVLWKTLTGDDIVSTPAADGENIYAATCSGDVLALRKADGKIIWRTAAKSDFGNINNQTMGRYGWRLTTTPAVCGDGKVFTQSNFTIAALDAKSGKVLWQRILDSGYSPASGVLFHDGKLYTSLPKQILTLDPANGKTISAINKKSADRGVAMPAAYSSGMYFPGQTLRKFDTGGKELWAVRLHGARYAVSPVAEGSGMVFCAHNDSFTAYDAATGKTVWTNKTKSTNGEVMKNTSSPVVFKNRVVYASDNGILYVADIKTGKVMQTVNLGAPVKSSPAVCGNLLCISTFDGRLIGFAAVND